MGPAGSARLALESMQPNAISDRALWDLITGSTAQRVGAAQIIRADGGASVSDVHTLDLNL